MFVSCTQAAHLMGLSVRRVGQLLSGGRIQGAFKVGRFWTIPLVEGMPLVSKGTRGPQGSWCRRKSSPVTIIHVNQQTIRQNQKREQAAPAISVKRGKENIYGHEVEIHGPCRVVYRRDRPLSCGARVWIETVSTVEVVNHLQVKPRLVLWECFRDCLAYVVSEANRARSWCELSDYN